MTASCAFPASGCGGLSSVLITFGPFRGARVGSIASASLNGSSSVIAFALGRYARLLSVRLPVFAEQVEQLAGEQRRERHARDHHPLLSLRADAHEVERELVRCACDRR